MEYFIVTLFKKKGSEKDNIEIVEFIEENIKNSYTYDFLFDIYEYSDVEFTEINICIENLIFNKNDFTEQLNLLSSMVELLFTKFDSILFGTGVYEIAYYLIQSYKTISEVSNFALQKFPIVFTRKPLDWYTNTLILRENFVVNVDFNAQNLF